MTGSAKTKTSGGGNAYSGDWSQNLCPASKYSIKAPYSMKPVGICMHNTANSAPAANEISYMNNNNNQVSYHLAVDENQAIQGLPFDRNGWHAGDGSGPGNRQHIGIEIARSTDYTPGVFQKAERRAACVVAKLCNQYGWGVNQVKAHRDFAAKDCPHRTSMAGFKNMVALALEGRLKADTSTTDSGSGGATSGGGSVKVGDTVKVTGSNYATGQTVPGWVKNNTYSVVQVSGDRALLGGIMSWVYMSDLAVQGATKTEPKKEEPKKDEPKKEEPKKDSSGGTPKQTAEEKKAYDAAVAKLNAYTGGKLGTGEFLSMFGSVAREDNRNTGVPASVTLAQAALETGWGSSTIGSAKNLFGIKGTGPAGSISAGTTEFVGGKYITITDNFRKYDTWLQSIDDHSKFLQKDRYKAAFNYCDDPDQFAVEIHKAGYATDPEYSSKLIKLMKQYDMYQYNVSGAKKTAGSSSGSTSKPSSGGASTGSVSVGSKVKIIGTNYATGQTVPGWVKNNTYSVIQVSGNKALLGGIMSWVYMNDLAVEGAPAPTPSSKPAASTSGSASPLDSLLSSHPEVKTNQDLINLFYKMGGNTFDGAAAQASKYGVNINSLVANRSGAVARSSSGGTTASSPSPSTSIGVGSKVRITGSNYATGQAIPGWVKNNTYTVKQMNGSKALIAEIVSWVYVKDLQLVSGGVKSSSGSSESAPASKPASSSGGSVGVGSTVKITGSNYATGQSVPGWVKNNTYSVIQMNGSKALLGGIMSWVYVKDLQLVSGGVKSSGGSSGATSAPKPAASGGSVGVGSTVKITGSNYATGQSIPGWVKNSTYSVIQMNGSKALLSGIMSWVYVKDLQLVSGGTSSSGGSSGGAIHGDSRLAQNAIQVAREMNSTGWCATGVSRAIQRTYGITVYGNGNQIDDNLPRNHFEQVYISLSQALRYPGMILTWESTATTLGAIYGHTAITVGNGASSCSDYYENNTAAVSGRSGFKCFQHK